MRFGNVFKKHPATALISIGTMNNLMGLVAFSSTLEQDTSTESGYSNDLSLDCRVPSSLNMLTAFGKATLM